MKIAVNIYCAKAFMNVDIFRSFLFLNQRSCAFSTMKSIIAYDDLYMGGYVLYSHREPKKKFADYFAILKKV